MRYRAQSPITSSSLTSTGCLHNSEFIAAMLPSTSTALSDQDMGDEQHRQVDEQTQLEACVNAVEEILDYKFRNMEHIEAALTHPSYPASTSYQRLEFVGDAALGLAFANFAFLAYPSLDPGQLSLLRAANISTEKLARVAVKHGLFRFIRHRANALDAKVAEFALAVKEEQQTAVHGGAMKAPKVLADIVESIAAAVYVDCEFNLKALWLVFRGLLEPIVTLETLNEQPQPVTMLYEVCQKQGKNVEIKHWRKESSNIASVFVDGKLIASCVGDQKEISRVNAARETLRRLAQSNNICGSQLSDTFFEVNEKNEINVAKQKLFEVCGKKKWPKPNYSVEKEAGPCHDRRFICSVQVKTDEGVLFMSGYERKKVKDAESSAASSMIRCLVEAKHIEGNFLESQLPL